MADEFQRQLTLWGDEVIVGKRKRGRPPFEWTLENSRKISMMLAVGWTNDQIAGCVINPSTGKSISVKTMQRHFSRELAERDTAKHKIELKQLMMALDAAEGGNVAAMTVLDRLLTKQGHALASARLREAAEPVMGKKDQARQDARDVAAGKTSSDWGDDLKPGMH